MLFQGFALDKIHHQVPAPYVGKLLVDARQVGMCQAGQQHCLAFESLGSFDEFLRTQAALAHLFDSYQPVAKLEIGRFIDSAETTFTHRADNAVALLE